MAKKKSMSDALASVTPIEPTPSADCVVTVQDDLTRIINLPRRQPLRCDRDPITKRYDPKAQALMEVMTERLSRGKRLSCACRERRVRMDVSGMITIERVMPEGAEPEPPVVTTVSVFVADNQTCAAEVQAARDVQGLQPGGEIVLAAADNGVSHPCILTLNPVQAWALYEAPKVGGILGFLGVGCGKSALSLLMPLMFSDCSLAALLAETNQKEHYISQYLRVREHFRVTSIVFEESVGYTVPGTPPLHFVPYSRLSVKTSTDLLERLNPDVVIDDEAHRVAGDSARERRQSRYLTYKIAERETDLVAKRKVRERAVRLLTWSGTLESKSVKNTQKLAAFSLGMGSPLPLDKIEAENWAAVMDPSRQPDRTSTTAVRLRKAFGDGMMNTDPIAAALAPPPEEAIRRGYRQRRVETPGVIATTSSSIDAAIYFSEKDAPKIPDAVQAALKMVREGERPDGDVIAEKARKIMVAKQVASGFYSVWVFSKHDPDELIKLWYVCRRNYFRELRSKLQLAEVHLDSELLCAHAAERYWRGRDEHGTPLPESASTCETCAGAGTLPCVDCEGQGGHGQDEFRETCVTCLGHGTEKCPACLGKSTGLYKGKLPVWDSECWPAWRNIKDRVKHDERIRWIGAPTKTEPAILDKNGHIVGEFLARDAAAWALNNKAVVWCISRAMGEKISELTGLPYHAGGKGGEERLRAEKGNRSVICSIKAFGSGYDSLQTRFNKQLLVEMPSSNLIVEQLLGRLHRQGQAHDEVFTEAYGHVQEIKDSFRKAYMQAEFNSQMIGTQQKLLVADITGFGRKEKENPDG